MTYSPKTFRLPALKGLSEKQMEVHLALYEGYVKQVNVIMEKLGAVRDRKLELDPYIVAELRRRFAFEFDGMRNHEYYFNHLVDGPGTLSEGSGLKKAIDQEWEGGFDTWFLRFKSLATTRGIGWAILYYDNKTNRFLNAWIDEQHLGHLTGLSPILALDMWEHSYLFDYTPAEKKKYVEAFFENLNWQTCEENYTNARK